VLTHGRSAREEYGNASRLSMDELASKTDQERARIFGGTALEVFASRT
jgi:hypothetical protein